MLDTIHEITEGRACPDHPFSHPLGFEVLAPLSLRDRWIFLRADRLALHVPASRTSSRHVLDWLRKPFCGGPPWLHLATGGCVRRWGLITGSGAEPRKKILAF